MWALHPRELSIVACIKYVKDLCCIGGLLLLILYTAKIEQVFLLAKCFLLASCCFELSG